MGLWEKPKEPNLGCCWCWYCCFHNPSCSSFITMDYWFIHSL